MSNNTSHINSFSQSSIRSPRIPSSSDNSERQLSRELDLRRERREQRELGQFLSQYNWEEDRKIEEEEYALKRLNDEIQFQKLEEFKKEYKKRVNLNKPSLSSSSLQRRNSYDLIVQPREFELILQESPQIADEEEDEEDDDPEYNYEKVTETGLDSDDEYLEEEYESDFDEKDDLKLRKGKHYHGRELIARIEYWITAIAKSKFVQGVFGALFLFAAIVLLASAIVHTNNNPAKYSDTRRTQYIPVDSLTEVNTKLKRFQDQLEDLGDKALSLSSTNDHLTDAFHKSQGLYYKHLEALNKKYTNIQNFISNDLVDNASLSKELRTVHNKLKNHEEQLKREKEIDIDHSKHLSDIFQQVSGLESNLENANHNIDQLLAFKHKVDDSIATMKESVLEAVLEKLPSVIPIISTEEGQIQMFPEVYDYLSEVVSNTVRNQLNSIELTNAEQVADMSWEKFVKQNEVELNQYITQFINNDLKLVKKQDFEQILVENFKANRDKLDKELLKIRKSTEQNVNELESKLSRAIHTTSEIDPSSASQTLIEHLIEKKLDENALKIEGRANYADIEQGAHVITKLTSNTLKNSLKRRKNFVTKAAFGWLDFLNRVMNGSSPEKAVLDPSNALQDNKSYWLTLIGDSHLGIRLAKEIMLTDILFKHPRNDNSLVLTSAPKRVSIYVKPTTRENQGYLKQQFASNFDQDLVPSLSEFSKIAEFEYDINNSHIHQFVPIPKEYVRLNIPIREIYIDIETNWGHEQLISLYNVKVFGVNTNEIKNAKKLLHLRDDATTQEVIKELQNRYLKKATYALDQDIYQDGLATDQVLGHELK